MAELLKLVSFFLRSLRGVRARAEVVAIIVLGIVGGIASTALIALVNAALSGGADVVPWFVALVAGLPLLRFASSTLLLRLSQGMLHELRLHMCRSILAAPLRKLEDLGPARMLASLTDDVTTIAGALSVVPMFSMHLTIVVCCLGYMGWLSWQLLLVTLAFVAVGAASYYIPIQRAQHRFQLVRQGWDTLLLHLRGLTEGTKELKLHRQRRGAFLSQLVGGTSDSLRRHNVAGGTIYAAAASWGNVLFFVLIGAVLFVTPKVMDVEPRVLSGFTLAILFMLAPLDMVLNVVVNFGRANIASRRIEELGAALASGRADGEDEGLPAAAGWGRLDLAGVTHSYVREADGTSFTLGPVDLSIRAGEMLFLVGGNGSGKTTLAKLLVGLYVPEDGEIRVDGAPVTDEARDSYRQHFSVVFQDFYLFDQLLGLEAPELDEQARHYLEELQLDRKVKVDDGKLSTLDLSRGQRKRLALLTAYLEDRPVYLFDEWAADQDPQFKDLFYCQLLPELRSRGKTVIVISHDDRYYELADRIVKLDSGSVVFDGPAVGYLAAGERRQARPARMPG